MNLLGALVGGLIGGLIGLALWAGVGYATHYEVSWIAWIVGVLCGVGVRVGSRESDGWTTGILAGVIAVASVVGGKFAVNYLEADKFLEDMIKKVKVTHDDAVLLIADDLVSEAESAGKTLKWPAGMNAEEATAEADYPTDIIKDAKKRWKGLSDQERDDYCRQQEDHRREVLKSASGSLATAGLEHSFSLFDVLWFVLAVGSAFKIASGVSSESDE